MITCLLHTVEDTLAAGRALGAWVAPGDVISLSGDLGAGKTTLTQGLAAGLGVEASVTSPTFTLIHEYQGPIPLYHMDFYRLEDPSEADFFGLDDYFAGAGVSVVEWADRLGDRFPEEHLEIRLRYPDLGDGEPQGRWIEIIPHGIRWGKRMKELILPCGL